MDQISEEQFRNLVDQFRIFNEILNSGSVFDRGADKIVKAIGVLSTSLDKNIKSEEQKNRALEDFLKTVEKTTEKAKENADATEKNTDQVEKNTDGLHKLHETEQNYKKIRKEVTGQEDEYFETNKKRLAGVNDEVRAGKEFQRARKSSAAEYLDSMASASKGTNFLGEAFRSTTVDSKSVEVSLRLLSAASEGVVKSLGEFTKSVYAGKRGAEVSAKAVTELATPVLKFVEILGDIISFASLFTPGGLVRKGLMIFGGQLLKGAATAGEAALKYNELAAKQADQLFKSFRELSTIGASGAEGMQGIFDSLQTLGMTMDQIEDYNKLVLSNANNLRLFGATMKEGTKSFAEVAGGLYKSQLGRQLELLGVSAEEQRESALQYMSILARTGQLQEKNTKQLIAGSGEFVKELDLAAQLTGTTRKEQFEARAMAMADERHRSAMIDARNRGDKAELERLELAEKMAAIAKNMGDKEGAAGILQYSAGGPFTKQSVAAMRQYNLTENLDNANAPKTQGAMMTAMAKAVRENQQEFAGLSRYIGRIESMQTGIDSPDDLQLKQKQLAEAAGKAGFKGETAIDEFLKTKQGQMMFRPEKDTKLMTDAGRAQQAAAMKMDSVVKTFNAAAKIHEIASTTFADAVKTFSETVGAKTAGGTPVYNEGPAVSAKPPAQTFAYTGGGAAVGGAKTGKRSISNRPTKPGEPQSQRPTNPGEPQSQRPTKPGEGDLSGLTIKQGDVHKEGSTIHPKLIDLAKKIQEELPGFAYFSGFNDKYHQENAPSSTHTQGLALDFALNKDITGDRQTGKQITDMLKSMGASIVIDEYNNPSSKATAGHFHAQISARSGFDGVLDGPQSGYKPDITMHGPEKLSIKNQDTMRKEAEIMSKLIEKFDTMIEKQEAMITLLDDGNDHSKKLVTALA